MRVNLYLDIYNPTANPTIAAMPLFATAAPMEKPHGCKRFKIVVDVPNSEQLFVGEVDGILPLDEKIKEVDV